MTQEHPITPPPELVQEWVTDFAPKGMMTIATIAARWGADQELEACCEWLKTIAMTKPWDTVAQLALELRDARRPKPVNLKKVAYDALDTYIYGNPDPKDKERTYNAIRRALESLPD